MKKLYIVTAILIISCILIFSNISSTNIINKDINQDVENVLIKNINNKDVIKSNQTILEVKDNIDTLALEKITDDEIGEFGLNNALSYFESQDRFDHEGVSVDRIINVNVDESCGGQDKIVLFKKNDLYAGMAKVDINNGKMEMGQHGPGNYSDREFDGVNIEKPYISLEEANENVRQLKEDLVFHDYTNPCLNGKLLSYSHLPYFRFVDSNGEYFLYSVNGIPNEIYNENDVITKWGESLKQPEDKNWLDVDYTKKEIENYFVSDIPEHRMKVLSSTDSDKKYELIFDSNPDIQEAAFKELLDETTDSGNLYLEDYYPEILSAALTYDTLSELSNVDFNKFTNIDKPDFIEYLKSSHSFNNLNELEKNELLSKMQ